MTSIETMPGVSPKARATYKLKVVSFNVQQLLAAQAREGKNQTEMASSRDKAFRYVPQDLSRKLAI